MGSGGLQTPSWKAIRDGLRGDGFAIVDNFLDGADLLALRQECEAVVEATLARLRCPYSNGDQVARVSGCIFQPVRPDCDGVHGLGGYLQARKAWPCSTRVAELLLGGKMRELVKHCLGTGGFVFNDQYIVKPPSSQLTAFKWHRDSDQLCASEVDYQPYISVWCALDNMTEGNGALTLLPGSAVSWQSDAASARPEMDARLCSNMPDSTALDRQVVANISAGSLVVLSDTVLHRSGPNLSSFSRRAWMPQFSSKPILCKATGCPIAHAVPLEALQEPGNVNHDS
ncbi:unnamed protein product [Ostreobium quekettii]|uniref:Phytanoyl-CoA dioxygenase n=1 Tax=Ostreobium quekettii TaxID=121088 RepID=A0A8S1J6F9_9CHLO|nr:unnamed protein product [Ostreobium quekettii]|eukprot:evm.model.scf_161.7 EVM.evm.TU.scf_161.7   scf_161:68789-73000(+)